MIIRGGENIYPREIEAALAAAPGGRPGRRGRAARAGSGARPSPPWCSRTRPTAPPSAELRALSAAGSPRTRRRPRRFAESLPANAMGKLQKFRLRDELIAGQLTPLE